MMVTKKHVSKLERQGLHVCEAQCEFRSPKKKTDETPGFGFPSKLAGSVTDSGSPFFCTHVMLARTGEVEPKMQETRPVSGLLTF